MSIFSKLKNNVFFWLFVNCIALYPIIFYNKCWWLRSLANWETVYRLNSTIYEEALAYIGWLFLAQFVLVLLFIRRHNTALVVLGNLLSPLRLLGLFALFLCLIPIYPASEIFFPVQFAMLLYFLIKVINHFQSQEYEWKIPEFDKRLAGRIAFIFVFMLHLIPLFNVAMPILDGYRDYLLTGDQPSYLNIAESVVSDGDIDVSNNCLPEGVYHDNFKGLRHAGGVGRHNPDLHKGSAEYIERAEAIGSARISTHRCGTSLIIAPFYYLGGLLGNYQRPLVSLFLIFATAFALREITLSAAILTGSPRLSLILGCIVGISIPVSCLSVSIYPELFVFCIVSRLIHLTVEDRLDWQRSLEIAVWLSLAPWFQDKYGVWVLPFALVRMYRIRKNWKSLALSAVPFSVSAFFMIKRNIFLYGQILPKNSLGYFIPFPKVLTWGLSGILFDWGYGLLIIAPFGFLTLAGLIVWYRNHKNQFGPQSALWSSIFVLLTGWLLLGSWFCWHGGFAPPNRFALTLLPIVAVSSILATQAMTGSVRSAVLMLWIISAALGLEALISPGFWYSRSLPSSFVADLFALNNLSVRFEPFFNYDQINIKGILYAIAGWSVMIYFSWNIMLSQTVSKKTQKSVKTSYCVLILLFVLFTVGHIVGFSKDNINVRERDIPSEIGVIKNFELNRVDNNGFKLESTLFLKQHPRSFAFAIHYLNENGEIVGQDDFDMDRYIERWLKEDKSNKSLFDKKRTIHIVKELSLPTNTQMVRIALYSPGQNETFRNLWSKDNHIKPLPLKNEGM